MFVTIKNKATEGPPASPADGIFKRIIGLIYSMAEVSMKSSDLLKKKMISGALPEGYPAQTRKLALKSRDDFTKWKRILDIPVELYRVCLYSNSNINYYKWCNNNFFGSKSKRDSCQHNFCQVCCDHLIFVYKNSADKNVIGELLEFKTSKGFQAILGNININTINQCKAECKTVYPVDMPKPATKPPRDPTLGNEKSPAMSCMDIKKWGLKTAKSGNYWINVASKGPQKVFCDMETDKGGWTMFFNYVHQPGAEMLLDENKLPSDLKANSHMHLQNAGFNHRDVKEIRFLCTERQKSDKKYWHFKTMNKEIIEAVMTGDQSGMKANSLSAAYTELKPPQGFVVNFIPAVRKSMITKFQYFGKNPKGGFTITPFGSDEYKAYWTVKGDDQSQDVYECGSFHRGSIANPEDHPNMVFTHHSIWFRGFPPSDDEARDRFMTKIGQEASK